MARNSPLFLLVFPAPLRARLLAAGFRLLIGVPQEIRDSSKKFLNINGLKQDRKAALGGEVHRILGSIASQQNAGKGSIALARRLKDFEAGAIVFQREIAKQ